MNELANLKEPPHSIEAERAVLGCILMDSTGPDGDRIWDVCQSQKVTPDYFFDPRNREVYMAMQEISQALKPIDHVSTLEKLKAKGKLEAIGGVTYLQSLYDETPTTAHAEYYLNVVKVEHLRRTIIDKATRTIKKCYDTNGWPDPVAILGQAEMDFLNIDVSANGEPKFANLLEKVKKEAKIIADSTERILKGLPTGFKKLDEKILGLTKSSMIVVGARPSIGKTSFAMNIAENVATLGHPVLIFSLEMSSEDLAMRMVSSGSGVNIDKLRNMEIEDPKERKEAYERFAKQADALKSAALEIKSIPNADIMSLLPIARRDKKERNTELIILDYLQLCSCHTMARQNSRQLEVAEISRQCKALARDLKVPVIVLSQLSRDNTKDVKPRPPRLSDLRDSGAIEQDADMVIFLRRPYRDQTGKDMSENIDQLLAYVNVAKNRNGETGEFPMNFEEEFTRFSDRTQQ